ncbi:MAG: single-stranded DNA-binding protein [Oscillatoria sp. SIO1A7]|nr:single-stranded DNA-binding protein [Oscillatoria sp. SIO1A7]
MNSFILMAEIVRDPELRYTGDDLPIAEMLVKFSTMRSEEPPATLRVVGWGNLAKEIESRYKEGDFVIIQGRLSINTIERREGFREKRAEMVASRIYPVEAPLNMESSQAIPKPTVTSSAPTAKVVALNPRRTTGDSGTQPGSGSVSEARSRYKEQKPNASEEFSYQSPSEPAPGTSSPPAPQSEEDLDEIPF